MAHGPTTPTQSALTLKLKDLHNLIIGQLGASLSEENYFHHEIDISRWVQYQHLIELKENYTRDYKLNLRGDDPMQQKYEDAIEGIFNHVNKSFCRKPDLHTKSGISLMVKALYQTWRNETDDPFNANSLPKMENLEILLDEEDYIKIFRRKPGKLTQSPLCCE